MRVHLSDCRIINDELEIMPLGLTYHMYIDYGIVNIYNEDYRMTLEESNVFLHNPKYGRRMYLFKDYIFAIQNNLAQIRGECISLQSFILNVQRGRIKLINGNEYIRFQIINNEIIIYFDNEDEDENILYTNNREYEPLILENNKSEIKNKDIKLSDIVSDSENVHDKIILDSISHIYNQLIDYIETNNIRIMKLKDCKLEFIKHLTDINKLEQNEINKFISIINHIINSNGYLYILNITESGVFKLVWTIIKDNNDLINIFKSNLLDMIMYSDSYVTNYYCLTGRVIRMLNTFSGIDTINLKKESLNKKMIHIEMMNSAIAIRKKLYNHFGFNEYLVELNLKDEIKQKFISDYVDTDILSHKELNDMISPWINEIY